MIKGGERLKRLRFNPTSAHPEKVDDVRARLTFILFQSTLFHTRKQPQKQYASTSTSIPTAVHAKIVQVCRAVGVLCVPSATAAASSHTLAENADSSWQAW